MLRDATLEEAFRQAATAEELEEFDRLKAGGYDCGMIFSLGGPPSHFDRMYSRYLEIWSAVGARLRERFVSGDWAAEGFIPPHGSQPQPIHRHLWRVLEIETGFTGVSGSGIRFVNLLVTETRPHRSTGPHHKKPGLRLRVTRHIEQEARSVRGAMTKKAMRARVEAHFADENITDNLFQNAWRAAALPDHVRQRGRPKS